MEDSSLATRPVPAPDAAAAVDELAGLIAGEAEALLVGGDGAAEEALADINLRLALLHWDVLEDAEAAARYLELADRHPLAPALALAHAVTEGSAEALVAASHALAEATPEALSVVGGAAAALRDVAEAWLYRFNDAEHAVAAARVALDRIAASEGAAADELRDELRHVYAAGLAAAGEWHELASLLAEAAVAFGTGRRSAPRSRVPVDALRSLGEAIHVYLDRLADADAARGLMTRALSVELDSPARPSEALARLYIVDRAIELAAAEAGDELDLAALLASREALLPADCPVEVGATRYRAAAAAERAGDSARARAVLAELAAPAASAGAQAEWGPRLAQTERLRLAIAAEQWTEAAAALRELAGHPASGSLAPLYERRAAEVLDARAFDAQAAVTQWRRQFDADTTDWTAARAVERLMLAGPPEPLIDFLIATAEIPGNRMAARRRAAAVAESRAGDVDAAMRLRAQAVRADDDIGAMLDVARLHRKQRDRDALAAAYLAIAERVGVARAKAALECAAGALHVSRGRYDAARAAFEAAARHAPSDPTAWAALADLHRRAGRQRELAVALEQLARTAALADTRVRALRELAAITADFLADPKAAIRHYEAALDIDADDVESLVQLARLYDKVKNWSRAVDLRHRAVDQDGDVDRRVELWLEIGAIEERHRKDEAAAVSAYEAALDLAPDNVTALGALARIHRRRNAYPELLNTLRRELDVTEDPQRRLALLLDIAEAAERVAGEAPLDAYLAVLAVDPASDKALAGVERIAVAQNRWDVIADAFAAAPPTAHNLDVLARALEQLDRYDALAKTRAAQIEFAKTDRQRAELAVSAAELYEKQLDNAEEAIDLYERALQFQPGHERARAALARLLETHARWPELAAALERELQAVPAGDKKRQMVLLARLAELRRDKLQKLGDAALAYEAILELAPGHMPALEALQELYERLDRPKDLLRVLEARAAAVDDQSAKVELWTRIAEVKADRGDIDGAVAAYQDAFDADPSSRDTFTALERLCYRHQRWIDAMSLYDKATELVESGRSRAYRLGDLYLRRGQVQLQYLDQPGEAAASYLRVIELDPDNDTAIKFLETIFAQQNDWAV
ncbi:MAG: hypothetical protein D6689_17660 [Deltaproteobacteria bacterium]|nr:MAG: hypothetical protein D6689_17660 [Deltaproteobacteria bacterium]